MPKEKEIVIVSVGGSLIVPDEIDVLFLKNFKAVIERQIKKGRRFVIITGGGKTCRKYQQAARDVGPLTTDDVDWLGIHSTRLNAHLMRTILRKYAEPVVAKDPTKKVKMTKPVLITAGWEPGHSTDQDAALEARTLKAKKLINLSNIDYAYTKDPKKYPDAKPITEITWKNFRKLIPKKWTPGLNSPFDPVASRECENNKIEVAILNGKHLDRFESYLDGSPTIGTIIR